MKKFEFEELSKVGISYGVIVFGVLVTLIGYSLVGFMDPFIILTYVGIIGALFFSFAKNEHFYSLFALLGLFVLAVLANVRGELVIGIITSIVFIGAIMICLNYYFFGNMKYGLIGVIGALALLTLITSIIMFAKKDAWGTTNPETGVIFLGLTISLVGALLVVLFMLSHVKKIDILKLYNVTLKKKKEVIELEEVHATEEMQEKKEK